MASRLANSSGRARTNLLRQVAAATSAVKVARAAVRPKIGYADNATTERLHRAGFTPTADLDVRLYQARFLPSCQVHVIEDGRGAGSSK